jgi:hypothetical protein
MTPRQFREEVFRRAGPDLSQSSLTAAVEHYEEIGQTLRGHIADCIRLADRIEVASKGRMEDGAKTEESLVGIRRGQIMISNRRAQAIRPWVEQTRQELFGSPTPPFPSYADAVGWIEELAAEHHRPGLSVEEVPQIEALVFQKTQELHQLAQALGGAAVSVSMKRSELLYAKPGEAWAYALVTRPGSSLYQLGEISRQMFEATGFAQPALVAYILSDIPPLLPIARWQIQSPSRQLPTGEHLVRQEVTLTFCSGFVTSDQLKTFHRHIRQAFGQEKARDLSNEDCELLKLVDERGGIPPRGKIMRFWEDIAREFSARRGVVYKPDRLRMRCRRLKEERLADPSLQDLVRAIQMLPPRQDTGLYASQCDSVRPPPTPASD